MGAKSPKFVHNKEQYHPNSKANPIGIVFIPQVYYSKKFDQQ